MIKLSSNKALLLFSGGQDSAVCLAWALSRFDIVETIGFQYGQRHHVELVQRGRVLEQITKQFPSWGEKLGADHVHDLSVMAQLGNNALTAEMPIEDGKAGLPTTFVPGRNIIFLSIAGALAYNRDIKNIVTGVCETDYSGYPDCRDATIQSMEQTLNLAMEADFEVHTPLMFIDKAASWSLARGLGGDNFVQLILEHSHTCYAGERTQRHVWGYGCGVCPACDLRAKGYEAYISQQ